MTDPTPPESSPEPSMEEILASIRQIISEDLASVAAAEARPSVDGDDDVLVLDERAPPEPSPFAPNNYARPQGATPQGATPQAPEPSAPERPAPESATPEPAAPDPQAPEAQAMDHEVSGSAPSDESAAGRSLTLAPSVEPAVVEPETAAIVAASFERLSFVVENTPPPPPFAVSAGGATLEDIARDILTPVIKAWLDENLPAIVRARVDEEVERITRSRVR